ncbi:hypothetical protein EAI_03067 [Harpegnathos saltator]|uniref:Uncharacterized protein n=1 Tax=Harpegnathos saltator TaxID=610380 RepID=E2BQY2_HARSA|nr:hypothetical protein EAI_03067 [Harpegnathos saltator]
MDFFPIWYKNSSKQLCLMRTCTKQKISPHLCLSALNRLYYLLSGVSWQIKSILAYWTITWPLVWNFRAACILIVMLTPAAVLSYVNAS